MKVTVVPAQVTTVEDRVAGSFGFSQLILFAIPVFGGALLYSILPPIMEYSFYKIVAIVVIALISCFLAIRIKGKIILLWMLVLARYNLRPKYFLFNKTTENFREDYPEPIKEPVKKTSKVKLMRPALPKLDNQEKAKLYVAMDNPINRLCFETNKKGGMNVRITEIQE